MDPLPLDLDFHGNRRDFLHLAAAAGAGSIVSRPAGGQDSLAGQQAPSRNATGSGLQIVDTNVSLFPWPFRRLPYDGTEALVEKLRSLGIRQAWAGSFEAVLHRDLASVNRRLADACQRTAELIPIGAVNPELPGWERDLQQCVDAGMPGCRVLPNYHGYQLDDSRFRGFLEQATSAGRFVQITVAMEDVRTQHPRVQVPDVDLTPLPDALRGLSQAHVQLLNWRPRGAASQALVELPQVSFDTARIEGTDAVPELAERVGLERVLFGTHAPFLIPEAALIRVHESGRFGLRALAAVLETNAVHLLKSVR